MTKNHNLFNERYRNTAVTGTVDTAQDKSDEKQVCIWTRQVPSLAKPGSLPTHGIPAFSAAQHQNGRDGEATGAQLHTAPCGK